MIKKIKLEEIHHQLPDSIRCHEDQEDYLQRTGRGHVDLQG